MKTTTKIVLILTIIVGFFNPINAQFLPTNYDEPFRGQYHFSQQSGWMNDINGLWFYDGVYNLTYQGYVNSLDGGARSWGRATSTDMLHWTQQPNALDPGVNVPGDCWSGSAVIDTNNTSGFQTGSNPPIVIIYTATTTGTCIAYSNDLGVTWDAYSGNPVNIGGTSYSPSYRDPHVFWYEPTSKWVCAFFENGTTFYTSSDLKAWTKVSNFNFGYECPDIFELRVDGGATKKWVLLQADGQYHIGTFDGTDYTPDAGGPHRMVNNASIGGGFYASQTFYKNTFPDDRIIQMGWMSGMGPGSTAPWTHNSTFPCEVKLQTFPEGVRVARTPISEISSLYGSTQTWGSQTLTTGQNLFAGKLSKCYDIEAVFDVSGATATAITFQFANRTVTYDLQNKTLFGASLIPINNQVKIRFLIDWGELEAFGNDGLFSYAENFKFTPSNSFISMTANGNINLVSARYSTINRVWPGVPCSAYADDADTENTYNGDWITINGESGYYNTTCHVATSTNSYVECAFSGTQVSWHALKNDDLGMAAVYIDDVLAEDDIDCYSTVRITQQLFTKTGLSSGNHTIKVVTKGTKNASSKGIALVHDYFSFIGSPLSPTAVDDASAKTTYSGTWTTDVNEIYYSTTCHISNTANSDFQSTFTGTQVFWYGVKSDSLGKAAVYIDDVLVADDIDCYSSTGDVSMLFSKTDLEYGEHKVRVVVKDTKNAASSGTTIIHDYFDFPVIPPTIIDDASASTNYNGSWFTANDGIYYDNICHVSIVASSSFQTAFTGSQIFWYALKNDDLGMATVYIDGVLVADDIDCYSTNRAVNMLFSKTDLANGSHTIKVVLKGTKNISSKGIALVHDYFSVVTPTSPTLTLTGSLSFGEVKKNMSDTKALTISNSHTESLTVSSIDLPDGFSADWTSGDIEGNSNKEVVITFAPTEEKTYSGLIKVNTNTGLYSIAIEGIGINVKDSVLPSDPNIQYMGRIDFSNPDKPLFAYPNVTIKASFEGTSLDLMLNHYNGSSFNDNYFVSIIDGNAPVRFIVTSGQHRYPIAKDLTDGTHTVEIVKITESYNGECEFIGFQLDSAKKLLTPEPLPDLKLEFLGNSITCGYGIEGGGQPISDNSYKAYPAVAARELDAQFHTISFSGIGVVKGWPSFVMSEMYPRTIALTNYTPFPANNIWDFTKYVPDFVVVALGTNDYGFGFGDGTISTSTFNSGYEDLITSIRTEYPNADIICTNSPMISDPKLGNSISEVVTTFNTAGDNKVYYFTFSHMLGGGDGGHPGLADGLRNGKELADYIKSLLPSASINKVETNKDDFTLYPNPTNGFISFEINKKSIVAENATIYSLQGQKVKSFVNTQKLDISDLKKGMYMVSVGYKGKTYDRAVILNQNK
ncbi:MAG: GDSL-type esterase/lipase family protein [Salinivirgaceae bacterium]|jgi:fructan beta-fructosidase|nr:GDSL-type esterase/lipase family protein [Salinivirgaceae bacterium]